MKPIVWASIAFVVVYALLAFGSRLVPRSAPKFLTDPTNLNLAIQVVVLLVAVLSLFVAISAYQDAAKSGDAQQAQLETQRGVLTKVHDALGSVVDQLKQERDLIEKQRQLMEGTQQASRDHLLLVERAYKEEQARLARRPRIAIGIADIPDEKLSEPIGVTVAADGWVPVDVMLRNDGDADLEGGAILIAATSEPNVHLETRPVRSNPPTPQQLQIDLKAVRTFSLTKARNVVRLEMQIPEQVDQPFDLNVHVLGHDAEAIRTFRFVATRAKTREP